MDGLRLKVAWSVRGISIFIALAIFFGIRRETAFTRFDNALTLWLVLLVSGVVLVNALLPPDYMVHVAWDLLLTLAAYTILPLPFTRQLLVALIISAGDLVLFWEYKQIGNPGVLVDIMTAFLCVNLLGFYTAWELHGWRRKQFLSYRREVDIRKQLEKALLEIKTLEGILPICSFCKNIRNDMGSWEDVDHYLAKHTDARLSHGLCPDCLKKEYPEEYEALQVHGKKP